MIAKNNYAWLPQHRTARKSPGKKIFQIQVALLVWRRLQVPAEIRLADLHEVLQVAMGWTERGPRFPVAETHRWRVGQHPGRAGAPVPWRGVGGR